MVKRRKQYWRKRERKHRTPVPKRMFWQDTLRALVWSATTSTCVPFGQKVWARQISADLMNRMIPRCTFGIWLAIRHSCAESFMGTLGGVFGAREFRRTDRQTEQRNDRPHSWCTMEGLQTGLDLRKTIVSDVVLRGTLDVAFDLSEGADHLHHRVVHEAVASPRHLSQHPQTRSPICLSQQIGF